MATFGFVLINMDDAPLCIGGETRVPYMANEVFRIVAEALMCIDCFLFHLPKISSERCSNTGAVTSNAHQHSAL